MSSQNQMISELSKELFDFQSDSLSPQILEIIANRGRITVHELAKSITEESKSSIQRRIDGSTKFIGLEKEGYIHVKKTVPFRVTEPRWKRYYQLTFKGFLASLSSVSLGRVSNFSLSSIPSFRALTGQHQQRFEEYVKMELCLWFLTHREYGFKLTYLRNAGFYYSRTKDVENVFGEPDADPVFNDASLSGTTSVLEVAGWKSIHLAERDQLFNEKMALKADMLENWSELAPNYIQSLIDYWPFFVLK